jgi:hypothetical protein
MKCSQSASIVAFAFKRHGMDYWKPSICHPESHAPKVEILHPFQAQIDKMALSRTKVNRTFAWSDEMIPGGHDRWFPPQNHG